MHDKTTTTAAATTTTGYLERLTRTGLKRFIVIVKYFPCI